MTVTQKELAGLMGVSVEMLKPVELADCSDAPKLRSMVLYVPAEMPRVARQVLRQLAKNSADPNTAADDMVFQRKRTLVHISRNELEDGKIIMDEDDQPVDADYHVEDELLVESAELEWTLDLAERVIAFAAPTEVGPVPIACPVKVIKRVAAIKKEWKFPELLGCVETPTLRLPAGTLLDTPGYDKASKLYYDPHGVKFPDIKRRPTKDECIVALKMLKRILADFPFADEDGIEGLSLSVALAGILTAVVRRSLPIAPMFGFDANEVESGKTLLAEILAIIATGRRTGARPFSDIEYQRETAIGAALDAGDAVILFDNVDIPITGAAIERCLTEQTFTTRRLGSNTGADQIKAPTNALMLATGNKLRSAGDMSGSRMVTSKIVPNDALSDRKFEHDSLEDYVMKERPKLVAAALTILLGYIAAGKPVVSPTFRFKAWRKLIADALIWLGEADPCLSVKRVQDTDPVYEDRQEVMRHWVASIGLKSVTTAKVVECSKVHAAIAAARGVEATKLMVRGTAEYLKGMVGVRVDGHRLHKVTDAHGASRWQIKPAKPAKPGEPWD